MIRRETIGRDTPWEENDRASAEGQSCLKSKAGGSSAQMTELDRDLRNGSPQQG